MSDGPSRRKVLFDEPHGEDGAFAAAMRGEATVGEVLAHMRAARGMELADVANHLRIREPFLAAIESGDLSRLPGPTYAIGFIRSYANFLGLNGEEAVRLFKNERDGEGEKAELVFPEPVSESRIPTAAMAFLSLLLIAAAYGGWYYLSSRDMTLSDLVPQVPSNLGGDQGGSTATTAPAPAVPEAAKDAAKAPAAPSAPPSASAPATPGAETKTAPVAVAPAPREAPVTTEKAPDALQKAPAEAAAAAPAEAAQATPSRSAEQPTPEKKAEMPAAAPEKAPQQEPATAPETEKRPASAPAPVDTATATPSAAEKEKAEPEKKAAEPAASSETVPAAPAPAPEKTVTAEKKELAPATQTASASGASEAIELRAKADSWVQIRGPGGRVVLMRILRTGDTYKVPEEKGLTLMTGNAGAIEITVDGKPVPAIGPYGAVRRDVALDAERLKAGTAVAR